MGACATKPQVLKDDVPEPIPEVVKEETSSNPAQLKKTDGVEGETTTKEIVGDVNPKDAGEEANKGDDGNKTLNSLLMESAPGEAIVESEKPTETVSIPSVPVIEAVKVEEVPKVEAKPETTPVVAKEEPLKAEPVAVVAVQEPLKVEPVAAAAVQEPLKVEPVAVTAVQEPVAAAVEVKGDAAVSK